MAAVIDAGRAGPTGPGPVTIRVAASSPPPTAPTPCATFGGSPWPATARRDRPALLPDPPRRGSGGLEPQFSPDGRWLAYSRQRPDHSGSPVVVPAGGGQSARRSGPASRRGGGRRRGGALGVNRRGQLLRARLGRVRIGGGRVRVLAGGATSFADAAGLSPDGRQVVTDSSRCVPPDLTSTQWRCAPARRTWRQSNKNDLANFAGSSARCGWLLYWAQSMCSASLSADGSPWPRRR